MSASAQHDAHEADPVARALATAHGILPDQGPIGVFIHHNTLHAFQHLPFHVGVQAGAAALGARPYLSLREFRAALAKLTGGIAPQDYGAAWAEWCISLVKSPAKQAALGKQAFYAQIGLDQHQAYAYAVAVMAAASQTDDAREGIASFLEKRPPKWRDGKGA